ncbi:MAG: hypothetical protein SF066_21860 [Thermoanaerobaculia bacterium]|nr:hypothetical protein [Thermoanaerobaculia bacterium]
MIPGVWSHWQFPLDKSAQTVFEKVQNHLLGVRYTPWAVATQVVNGMNYAFVCGAQAVAPDTSKSVVLLEAYVPPGGEPHVPRITRINP